MAHMPSLSCSTRMKSARGCITSIISNLKGWVQEPLTKANHVNTRNGDFGSDILSSYWNPLS